MKKSNLVPTSVPSNSNLRNWQWSTHAKSPNSLTLPPIYTRNLFKLLLQPLKICKKCKTYPQTTYIFHSQIHHSLHNTMPPFLPKRKLKSKTLLSPPYNLLRTIGSTVQLELSTVT